MSPHKQILGKNLYIGELMFSCSCHGINRGWSFEIERVLAIRFHPHSFPWVHFLFGKDVKFNLPSQEQYDMLSERARR